MHHTAAPGTVQEFENGVSSGHNVGMGVFATDGSLALRLMRDEESDYAVLSGWLSDPRVLEFYEGRDSPQTLDDVRTGYSPRVMALEENTPCFLELDGVPIGYVQFYPAGEPGVWGIDQFIGSAGAAESRAGDAGGADDAGASVRNDSCGEVRGRSACEQRTGDPVL